MSKHSKREGGIKKSAAYHGKNNSHHRKANEKNLSSHGENYGSIDGFTRMHTNGSIKSFKKGGMC